MRKKLSSEMLRAIEVAVRESTSGEVIDFVDAVEDQDRDGDPIIRVLVVFKAGLGAVEARNVIRHVRPAIRNAGSPAFPVVSFRAKGEHSKLVSAAA